MAPNLSKAAYALIVDMLAVNEFTCVQIADAAECHVESVRRIRRNIRYFGTGRAPENVGGRPPSLTPPMFEALCEHLLEKPDQYLDEMAVFLWDEFGALFDPSTISRTLSRHGWSNKIIRRRAREQNQDLRDFYLYNLSAFKSYQLVYVDESGCDKRIGFRRRGWSPLGTTPLEVTRFHRSQRYQILPAYTQDGILLSRVFQGSTDTEGFEDFLEELLQWCGRWPEPRSVLIMDNASFHHSPRIERLCFDAGVKLLYLPPYSPDLNPIEEFFAELKTFIKRHWTEFAENPDQSFHAFLDRCIATVGSRTSSAEGHFKHAGVGVQPFQSLQLAR